MHNANQHLGCTGILCQRTHLASVKNASSTPSLTFADVSMNLMPSSAASSRPCSSVTARLSVQSDLLPMRILLTPSEACCSMLACHVLMSVVHPRGQSPRSGVKEWNALLNDRSSVTSYTRRMPIAPR